MISITVKVAYKQLLLSLIFSLVAGIKFAGRYKERLFWASTNYNNVCTKAFYCVK